MQESKVADTLFVRVKAGDFMMGASENDHEASHSEKPQHKVTISKDFYISKFEVTQKQWEDVMGYSCFDLDRSNPFYNLPGMKERITKPDHPANVSWEDAQKFINKLNEKEGKNIYRLPTEAEWEYAAKAGTTTAYSFGDNKKDLDKYAWYGGDFSTGGTHPVGKKLPNPWGLYDVHGNVWEWVQDWYSDDYFEQSPQTDPKGPDAGSNKVVKGGSWHATSDSWRSSFRKPYKPDYRGISIGFRIIKEVE
ncbi:formylglycine-generating enzyme family protein [Sphingobacterium thalpophilum]|nr:formylglycine-generating enzyme family protein [Sphingobacterium thalpophilum]